jgi:hypothetical protein
LAAWTLPKVLAGFKAASSATVSLQRFSCTVEGALHLRMKFFVLKLLVGNPLRRSDQRRFAF